MGVSGRCSRWLRHCTLPERSSKFWTVHSVTPGPRLSPRAPILGAVLFVSAGAGLPAPRSPHATGRIEGTVIISRQLSVRRPQYRPYAEPGTGSLPPASPTRDSTAAELKNVVVYLEGDSTRLPFPETLSGAARHGVMAQRGERFVPHVLPVVQGTTVDFPNEDDVYHNVFSLSAILGRKPLDLGRYPKGQSKSFTFSTPGTVQLFCHIHSDMSGVVLVLANPFFAIPGDDHRYVIDDVPEGDYTIVGWHERIKPISRRVHVTAGKVTTLDFDIPLPRAPESGGGGGAATR